MVLYVLWDQVVTHIGQDVCCVVDLFFVRSIKQSVRIVLQNVCLLEQLGIKRLQDEMF